jgi:hypothetical protein
MIKGKDGDKDDDDSDASQAEESETESEMISQLKEKFKLCTLSSEKLQVLTVLPKSWSIKKTEQEFQVSNYMVRKAKKLVEEKGILSTPNPRSGKTLPSSIVDEIKHFYYSDTISRLMPGMKDYVSVCINGKIQPVQKRLVLCNLKEAYEQYKQKNPEKKIGF